MTSVFVMDFLALFRNFDNILSVEKDIKLNPTGGSMNKTIVVLVMLTFSLYLAGCATVPTGDIRSLQRRVSALEDRQQAIERNITYPETITATPAQPRVIEVREASLTVDPAAMNSRDIQTALRRAGYDPGPIDGKIGPQTERAVKRFQTEKGLKVDGVVGPETRRALAEYLRR